MIHQQLRALSTRLTSFFNCLVVSERSSLARANARVCRTPTTNHQSVLKNPHHHHHLGFHLSFHLIIVIHPTTMAQNPLLGTFDHILLHRRGELDRAAAGDAEPWQRQRAWFRRGCAPVAPALGRWKTFLFKDTHTCILALTPLLLIFIKLDTSQANVYR